MTAGRGGRKDGTASVRDAAALPSDPVPSSRGPTCAQDAGDGAKPEPGSGSNLAERDTAPSTAAALHLLQQRDTPLGRIEASVEAMQLRLERMEARLSPKPAGRPAAVEYQVIEQFYRAAAEAVRGIVTDCAERDTMLSRLTRIKKDTLRGAAKGRLPAALSDPKDAAKSRGKRERRAEDKQGS